MWNDVRELIFTLKKKKKKAQTGHDSSNFPHRCRQARKTPPAPAPAGLSSPVRTVLAGALGHVVLSPGRSERDKFSTTMKIERNAYFYTCLIQLSSDEQCCDPDVEEFGKC